MKKFFSGKRLCMIIAVALILGVGVAVRSCVTRTKADVTITYIGENYFDSDAFYANSALLDDGMDDVNGDGLKKAELAVISFAANLTASQEQNNLTKLTVSMGGGESRVYIMDKAYCQRYADSEVLADLSGFSADTDALINGEGKVYGISVEGNSLLEKLGLSDTEDVFVALRAVSEMDGVNFKNIDDIDASARKTVEYIILNNNKE